MTFRVIDIPSELQKALRGGCTEAEIHTLIIIAPQYLESLKANEKKVTGCRPLMP